MSSQVIATKIRLKGVNFTEGRGRWSGEDIGVLMSYNEDTRFYEKHQLLQWTESLKTSSPQINSSCQSAF